MIMGLVAELHVNGTGWVRNLVCSVSKRGVGTIIAQLDYTRWLVGVDIVLPRSFLFASLWSVTLHVLCLSVRIVRFGKGREHD